MTDIETYIVNWFESRSTTKINVDMNESYFNQNLIDSLGVFDLVDAIEEHYNIQFPQEAFQDRRFSTVSGLAAIVNEIRSYESSLQ